MVHLSRSQVPALEVDQQLLEPRDLVERRHGRQAGEGHRGLVDGEDRGIGQEGDLHVGVAVAGRHSAGRAARSGRSPRSSTSAAGRRAARATGVRRPRRPRSAPWAAPCRPIRPGRLTRFGRGTGTVEAGTHTTRWGNPFMPNRLAQATSPYLLQHAGQPRRLVGVERRGVRGGAAAQRADPAERRVRRLPLVPRDGARVVRGRGDGGVPERALREHQGRPRGAARRRRGLHAGDRRDDRPGWLADDLRARPRGQPVLRRHLLPGPAAARPAQLPPAARGDRRRLGQPLRRGGCGVRPDPRRARQGGRALRRRRLRHRRPSTRPWRRWRASSTPTGAASAERRSSRRRWCSTSCCGTAATSATADGRQDPRGDGGRRDPRPAGRRLRAVRRRPGLGGAALREDALRQRPAALGLRPLGGAARRRAGGAGRARGGRLHARRAGHRRGRLRLGARRGLRGRGGHLLRLDPRAARRGARSGRRRLGGDAAARVTDDGHLRERHARPSSCRPSPTTRSAGSRCGSRLLEARADAGAPGPRRQGGGGLERAGDQRPGRCGHPARRP